MGEIGILIDLDWAPDAAIDDTAGLLREAGVHATWFVTHRSPAVDRLAEEHELFELGVHPNFLRGSTHGENAADVLEHCMRLVPQAIAVRTHGLVQSTALVTQMVAVTPLRIDASVLLPRVTSVPPAVLPTAAGPMVRVTCCWEDDVEMLAERPVWRLDDLAIDGLALFCFHPIHVWRNHASLSGYEAMKRAPGGISEASASDPLPGLGSRSMFLDLLTRLRGEGSATLTRHISRYPEAAAIVRAS